jgi:microcystin-dependent protein
MGELKLVPYNFAPRNWAFADGSLLSIAQNSALFSLLGTTYGGNGQTTFALPDLRGRVPVGVTNSQAPGLSNYVLGQVAGTETVTLINNQMPAHNHFLAASSEDAAVKTPGGNVLATTTSPAYVSGPIDATMNPASIGVSGGSQPHPNMQPYLALNWIIALNGIYPSRN